MAAAILDSSYRAPREFTSRMRETTNVYLEHSQFTDAFEIMTNVTVSGNSTGSGHESHQPALSPTPEQLSLAATLVVHPSFTTRANSSEDRRASDEALRFLRTVHATLGPVNAHLSEAFSLHGPQPPRTYRRQSQIKTNPDSGEEDRVDKLDSEYAQRRSLFVQAENFWQIVGWAFNCAVKWPDRYARWQLMLKFWIEAAEKDLLERQMLSERHGKGSFLVQSMAWSMLKSNDGSAKQKAMRIFRATMADGNDRALNEFREIWKNETKRFKKSSEQVPIRETVKLDENQWGDYQTLLDEDVEMEDEPTGAAANIQQERSRFVDSIDLRGRLISLMIKISLIPNNPLASIGELLDTLAEFIRPLDLATFQKFLTYIRVPSGIGPAVPTSIILPFLSSPPRRIDILRITQDFATSHFVTSRANSADPTDQVKLNLLIENLIVQMIDQNSLHDLGAFRAVVEQGIESRKAFASEARRRLKRKGALDQAIQILDESSERMLIMLDFCRYNKLPQERK